MEQQITGKKVTFHFFGTNRKLAGTRGTLDECNPVEAVAHACNPCTKSFEIEAQIVAQTKILQFASIFRNVSLVEIHLKKYKNFPIQQN